MQWDIVGKVRAQIVTWSGTAFSGVRKDAYVSPLGGVTDEKGVSAYFRSFAIAAPYGTRVTLISRPGPDWEQYPWRSFHVLRPFAFKTPEGKPCIQCPDLESLHAPNATRIAYDFSESVPVSPSLAAGTGWTFGCSGTSPLAGNVHMLRLDYVRPV